MYKNLNHVSINKNKPQINERRRFEFLAVFEAMLVRYTSVNKFNIFFLFKNIEYNSIEDKAENKKEMIFFFVFGAGTED